VHGCAEDAELCAQLRPDANQAQHV
jgi:hypothetical protein